jgi:hypothetical protein
MCWDYTHVPLRLAYYFKLSLVLKLIKAETVEKSQIHTNCKLHPKGHQVLLQ